MLRLQSTVTPRLLAFIAMSTEESSTAIFGNVGHFRNFEEMCTTSVLESLNINLFFMLQDFMSRMQDSRRDIESPRSAGLKVR